jgi:nitroreductase
MDIEYLLTATRSARKSLDLNAPVGIEDIRECLRIGLQAANGSNQQPWRWLVVTDPALRDKLAELYRDAYLLRVGGQMLADVVPAGTPEGRLMSSTEWLVQNMARVPLLVIPCYEPYLPRIDGDESFHQATLYGSIFPAVWNFGIAHPRVRDVRHDFAPAPRRRGPAVARDSADLRSGLSAASAPPPRRAYVSAGPPAARRRGGRTRPLGWPRPLEWVCHHRIQRICCEQSGSL